jgi:NAD-dependent deacetylase
MLHHKAGSKHVLELHGTLRTLSCTQCYQEFGSENFLQAFIEDGGLPHCLACGALLKPNVILFGEQLPQKTLLAAQQEIRKCDLVMVIGSSLEVLPVAALPMQAIDHGAHLIIINNNPTYLNVRADIVLPEDVAKIIPAIADKVLYA